MSGQFFVTMSRNASVACQCAAAPALGQDREAAQVAFRDLSLIEKPRQRFRRQGRA